MDQFLTNVFSFPTIIFTLPLLFIAFYWISVFLGMIDIEILDADVDVAIDAETGVESSTLEMLGLDGVPLTIAITLLDLYAWVFTYIVRKYLITLVDGRSLLDGMVSAATLGTLTALLACVVAIPLAAITIKPLRRVFVVHEATRKSDLTGRICTITTLTVTSDFGQAVTDKGSMVLRVRAAEPNDLKKGDRVVLLEFDRDSDSFQVVTEQQLLNQ